MNDCLHETASLSKVLGGRVRLETVHDADVLVTGSALS